jgi:hypothetical protein
MAAAAATLIGAPAWAASAWGGATTSVAGHSTTLANTCALLGPVLDAADFIAARNAMDKDMAQIKTDDAEVANYENAVANDQDMVAAELSQIQGVTVNGVNYPPLTGQDLKNAEQQLATDEAQLNADMASLEDFRAMIAQLEQQVASDYATMQKAAGCR